MSLSNDSLKEMDRRLDGRRLIEEFDHQRQIDVKSQHVVRVNLAIGAKAGDASEDSDSLHRVLVMRLAECSCRSCYEYSMADIITFPWIHGP